MAGLAFTVIGLVVVTLFPKINRKLAWSGFILGLLLLGAAGAIAFLPDGNAQQVPVNITGGDNVVSVGQIGGITARTVTINPPLKPELRILGRDESEASDGTHTVIIRTEVVSPISPGLLVIQIQAQGIRNVLIMPPPTGGVSMMAMRNVRKSANSFSAEIPGPRGRYDVTVVTAAASDVRLDASF